MLGPADARVLRVDRAHPARRRGDDRVPRPLGVALAGSRRPRDVGWVLVPGRDRALDARRRGGRAARRGGRRVRARLRGVLGGLHRPDQARRRRWAGLEGCRSRWSWPRSSRCRPGSPARAASCSRSRSSSSASGWRSWSCCPTCSSWIALRRLPTALFGVIMSLEPAIAAAARVPDPRPGAEPTGIVVIAMVSIAGAERERRSAHASRRVNEEEKREKRGIRERRSNAGGGILAAALGYPLLRANWSRLSSQTPPATSSAAAEWVKLGESPPRAGPATASRPLCIRHSHSDAHDPPGPLRRECVLREYAKYPGPIAGVRSMCCHAGSAARRSAASLGHLDHSRTLARASRSLARSYPVRLRTYMLRARCRQGRRR